MEKGEGTTTSDPSSSSSAVSGTPADPNPCPICLGPVSQDSYLDICFHRFCYACIVRWMNVVRGRRSRTEYSLKCPLCKTENFSIIFGFDGSTFQRHHIHQETLDSSLYSEAHKYRLQCYYTEHGGLNNTFHVEHYWKFSKYLQPNKWLKHWLRRELQALTQEEDVDVLVHHILGVIESFRKSDGHKGSRNASESRREGFKSLVIDAARPFLGGRTERFVDEMELFLGSGFTMEAYDNIYKEHLGRLKSDGISRDVEDTVGEPATVVVHPLLVFDDSSDEAD